MVESLASLFNIMDYLGKPIQSIRDLRYFKKQVKAGAAVQYVPCEFEEAATRSGTPKGKFYTCKEMGFQAFVIDNTNDAVDFIVLFNAVKDQFNQYPYQLPNTVTFSQKNQDIVRMFGDTKDKGGGSIPIWIK